MKEYQRQFLQVSLDNAILNFRKEGYILKSGRLSPYFFNAGLFNSGHLLTQLCTAYAKAVLDPSNDFDFDLLFGPAYKGIPLAVATCSALDHLGHNVEFAFNRKEVKDHGEGGSIVGASLQGKKVVIIDDVITSGKAIREAIQIIQCEGGILTGILVALDRQERTQESQRSAIQAVVEEFGVRVLAIITMDDIIEFTKDKLGLDTLEQLEAYRAEYGIKV
jgi:orotate phosphoribosyltransferase